MRKSEAIRQLAGYLSTFHWYEERHPEELLELAKTAVEGMEKIGMTPPLISGKRVVIGRDGITGEPAAWDVSGRPIYAWEEE